MAALAYNSSNLSSYYKMDNVLYEIKDQRGILKNTKYEPWKAEVLADLQSFGFIKLEGDKYVITEEGREVINHDSLVYYTRKTKLKTTEDVILEIIEGRSDRFWAILLGLSLLFVALVVGGTKLQILSFLF